MKSILKRVSEAAYTVDIDNTLEALQKAVGGYLEAIGIDDGLIMLVDEDGRMKKRPYNFDLGNSMIVGDVLIVRSSDGEFTDLTKEDIEKVIYFFNRTPYTS